MHKRLLMLVLLPLVAHADRIPPPLTAAKMQSFLATHPHLPLEAFLEALPDAHRQNASLVFSSRSLQQATPDRPRQVFYGVDARLLLAVSSVESDPLYRTIEFAEFNDRDGRYDAGTITFSSHPGSGTEAPIVDTAPTKCAMCHGARWRPIWGTYPGWPGVYGQDFGDIAGADIPGFRKFLETRLHEPHLKALDMSFFGGSAPSYHNKGRSCARPNTTFGLILATTVGEGGYIRIRRSPDYDRLKWLVVETMMDCGDEINAAVGDAAVKLYLTRWQSDEAFRARYPDKNDVKDHDRLRLGRYRLLGVNPTNELIRNVNDFKFPSEGWWWAGFVNVFHVIELDTWDEILAHDSEMRNLFGETGKLLHDKLGLIRQYGNEREKSLRAGGDEFNWFYSLRNIRQSLDSDHSDRRKRICRAIERHLPN